MMFTWLIELAAKSLLCAGAVLLLLRLLRSRSAAEKSVIAQLGLLALVLLPLGMILLPPLAFTPPAPVAAIFPDAGAAAVTPSTAAAAVAGTPVARPTDWNMLALALYALPALALLLGLLIAIGRLQRILARADVLTDPRWLAALARAQQRLGLKHGTALLASDELNSPVSWGVMRPIIIVDPAAAADPAHAEAIIAHELAHVVRLDWLRLLVGRLAIALHWFNPLVWVLARQAHHWSEEAADDAVLRADIDSTDYAELLLGTARHANRAALLAANGVAPSRSSLARRVSHVLDGSCRRGAARGTWVAGALLGALGLNVALSAAEPVANAPVLSSLASTAMPQSAASLALAEALIAAAERADLTAMAELIESGASPDSVRDGDGTPLIAAARAGRADAVSFLLSRGADVNLAVEGDGNPLIAAAGAGQTGIVRLLLDRGADIEAAVPDDENALITASRRGQAEVARLLVARGADVNRILNGRTALAMAQAGGHRDIAALLREAGAMR